VINYNLLQNEEVIMSDQVALRKQAVRRYLSGETKRSICRDLSKSPGWLSYWLARYDPDDPEHSLENHSTAPHQPHRKWSEEVIQFALNSRRLRQEHKQPGYEYALIGAEAIHFEMNALDMELVPPVRTIHYWIKEAHLVVHTDAASKPDKESKLYPTPKRDTTNALHQLDLKGPFYLQGSSQKHYLVAIRDFCSKRLAITATMNRRGQTIAEFLVSAWRKLGLPDALQMDNAMELRGSNRYPRSFGKVVRLCLDLDVEPIFIPPSEPWRNGFIENLNGLAQRLLLSRVTFDNDQALLSGTECFEQAVNGTHRLAALGGKTPDEFIVGHKIRPIPTNYSGHKRKLNLVKGYVSFIRLVRKSGRITTHAKDKFDIDPDLKWQYVLARADIKEQKLRIYHQDGLIKVLDYAR
jgi:transposase InsO family protein